MLTDTPIDVERFHLQLLRQQSDAQRLASTLQLTQMVRDLARQAIAEAHPDLSPQQQALKFVQLHYGQAVVEMLRGQMDAS